MHLFISSFPFIHNWITEQQEEIGQFPRLTWVKVSHLHLTLCPAYPAYTLLAWVVYTLYIIQAFKLFTVWGHQEKVPYRNLNFFLHKATNYPRNSVVFLLLNFLWLIRLFMDAMFSRIVPHITNSKLSLFSRADFSPLSNFGHPSAWPHLSWGKLGRVSCSAVWSFAVSIAV